MTNWKIKAMLVAVVLSFLFFSNSVSGDTKESKAVESSIVWLALVDSGKYSESWEEAAAYFKSAISKEQWQAVIKAVRRPLGRVISREIKSKQFTETLPGTPDGQYVVIQYKTSFEYKKSAVETITPMLDKDSKWRVSGYYIR